MLEVTRSTVNGHTIIAYMPLEDIRVALIGYGLGGRSFHAPIISATSGFRLGAIVTSNPERKRQAAAEHPQARIVDNADEIFSRASEFDIAVITTPNRTHVALATAALEAGLPVVVDKPLTPTSDQARQLVELADRKKLLLTVYQNRRWDGDFLTLQRLLRENALGRVHRFESRFERWRSSPKPGWRESADPEDAGGLLYDLGAHLIDQALVLLGPVTHVYAELDRRRPDVVVDDDVFVALTHASGARSQLWISMLAADRAPRFRLFGARGTYTKHGMDVQEEALRRGERADAPGWGIEPREQWGSFSDGQQSTPVESEPGSYPAFYSAVAESLRRGGPPPVDPRDAITTIRIIEAAKASAHGDVVVKLQSP